MKIVIALVFAASLCRTLALPDGAPPQACADLTPGHGQTPRPNPSSSTIDLIDFAVNASFGYMYDPGATYFGEELRRAICTVSSNVFAFAVRLVSTGTFRGFLINVQTLGGRVVGEFMVHNNTDVQLSNCGASDPATYPVNA